MNRIEFSRSTLVPIGVVITLCGMSWKLSSRMTALEERERYGSQTITAIDAKVDRLLEMKTDIEVMRAKIQAMERPIMHTHSDVQSLRREVALINMGPLGPYYRGPLTMSGLKLKGE